MQSSNAHPLEGYSYPSKFVASNIKRHGKRHNAVGFLDLSPELRNQIYRLVLDPKGILENRYNNLPNFPLTRVCKAIRHDTLAMSHSYANTLWPFRLYTKHSELTANTVSRLQRLPDDALANFGRFEVVTLDHEKSKCGWCSGHGFQFDIPTGLNGARWREQNNRSCCLVITRWCANKIEDVNALIRTMFRSREENPVNIERVRQLCRGLPLLKADSRVEYRATGGRGRAQAPRSNALTLTEERGAGASQCGICDEESIAACISNACCRGCEVSV